MCRSDGASVVSDKREGGGGATSQSWRCTARCSGPRNVKVCTLPERERQLRSKEIPALGSLTRVLRLTSALGFWSVLQTFIFTFQLLFSRYSITRSKDRRKNTIDGGGLRSLLVFVHGDVKNSFFLVQEHIADLLFIPIEDLLTFKNGGA